VVQSFLQLVVALPVQVDLPVTVAAVGFARSADALEIDHVLGAQTDRLLF
jgi:hypothetical protein